MFIKILASWFIVLYIVIGMVLWIVSKIFFDPYVSNDRWELIEKTESGWSYWRDKKHPEICTLWKSDIIVFGLSLSVTETASYIPCDKLK